MKGHIYELFPKMRELDRIEIPNLLWGGKVIKGIIGEIRPDGFIILNDDLVGAKCKRKPRTTDTSSVTISGSTIPARSY